MGMKRAHPVSSIVEYGDYDVDNVLAGVKKALEPSGGGLIGTVSANALLQQA